MKKGVVIGLAVGLVLGWFGSAQFAPRYSFHPRGLFIIDSHTGIVWAKDGDRWKHLGGPNTPSREPKRVSLDEIDAAIQAAEKALPDSPAP